MNPRAPTFYQQGHRGVPHDRSEDCWRRCSMSPFATALARKWGPLSGSSGRLLDLSPPLPILRLKAGANNLFPVVEAGAGRPFPGKATCFLFRK